MSDAPREGLRPLRPQDAFFRYVETSRVRQQIGAVIVLGADSAENPGIRLDAMRPDLTRRLADLPLLRRVIVRRRAWQRPAWRLDVEVRLEDHVSECWIDSACEADATAKMINDFFAAPLRLDRPPWEMQLLHDRAGGPSVMLAKTHHALGDGAAVLGTMIGLLADEELTGVDLSQAQVKPPTMTWKKRWRRYRKIATGLRALATAGTAPRFPARGSAGSGDTQTYSWVDLPTAAVQASARAHRVNAGTFLLAVIAEALHRGGVAPEELRALVPKTTRGALPPSGAPRAPGNWSAAVSLDLPLGPMPPAQRVAEIAARNKRLERAGEPPASQVAMAAFGLLPAPLHAWISRVLYGRRFFNLLVTILPGPTQHPHLAGTAAESIYPLLPLADGVGLGVCSLRWVDITGLGITTDPAILGEAKDFAVHLRAAFDALSAGT